MDEQSRHRFLLGKGELLTRKIPHPGRSPWEPDYPRSVDEALSVVSAGIAESAGVVANLPAEACPGEYIVLGIQIEPRFIAKSYFPSRFLSFTDMTAVGSRPCEVDGRQTYELFAAIKRGILERLPGELPAFADSTNASNLQVIRSVRALGRADRQRGAVADHHDAMSVEIVLHHWPGVEDSVLLDSLSRFFRSRGCSVNESKAIFAKGLVFMPGELSPEGSAEVADFSLLRVMRPLVGIRPLDPVFRRSVSYDRPPPLPDRGPIDDEIRCAIFDGGISPNSPLSRWAKARDVDGVGLGLPSLEEHGTAVTSAALFGHVGDSPVSTPFSTIDHFRVLDRHSGDESDLFDVLARIETVLLQHHYDFVNLSIGPNLPIDDDEVHVWTAKLDELFHERRTTAFVAIGNNGEFDSASGNNRVMVPADCVNAIAVGATPHASRARIERASYSAVGPGRSPGFVKPDLVTFGGSQSEPFVAFAPGKLLSVVGVAGTSFASPAAMRIASGIRATLGPDLGPEAIRSLLIHGCVRGDSSYAECGFGACPTNVEEIILCSETDVTVLFQGTLLPSNRLRVPIPLPADPLVGMVSIRATLCISSDTDPEDPFNYTKSGIDAKAAFDTRARDKDGSEPKKRSGFFKSIRDKLTEYELRSENWKWETVMHGEDRARASSLHDPELYLHYVARDGGAPDNHARPVHYGLAVTVGAPKVPDLYDQILSRYRNILSPIEPRFQIRAPIRVQ